MQEDVERAIEEGEQNAVCPSALNTTLEERAVNEAKKRADKTMFSVFGKRVWKEHENASKLNMRAWFAEGTPPKGVVALVRNKGIVVARVPYLGKQRIFKIGGKI